MSAKVAAAMAVALFVVAQPQVFCALHCMIFRDMVGMADTVAASSHQGGRTLAMPCDHGTTLTSGARTPVAGVSFATVAWVETPVFVGLAPVATFSPAPATPSTVPPRVDTPPPRA